MKEDIEAQGLEIIINSRVLELLLGKLELINIGKLEVLVTLLGELEGFRELE